MAPHPAKAQSVTSYHSPPGLRYFEPKPLIQGLSHCGKCSPTLKVWYPSPFAVSPAPFSDQGRKSQAEVTTAWPGLDKDACSLEAPASSWSLARSCLFVRQHHSQCVTVVSLSPHGLWTEISTANTWVRRSCLWGSLDTWARPQLKDRLEAPAESRPVCFAQNQEAALQWIPLHQTILCSQPCDSCGCQVRAVSQCLSLMKGFNHVAWPERHMLS